MVASAPDDTRLLAFLIVIGAVGMAVVGVFLGIGFLLLGPGHPAIAPAGRNVPGDAVEAHEVLPIVRGNDWYCLTLIVITSWSGQRRREPRGDRLMPWRQVVRNARDRRKAGPSAELAELSSGQ